VRPKSGKGGENRFRPIFLAHVMGEKRFLPTSTPRWQSCGDAFSAITMYRNY
jgi:hypothetical protein